MTIQQTDAELSSDELDGVVDTLCKRFPDRDRDEVAALVRDSFRKLAAEARVLTHLVPLTLNRSGQVLQRTTQRM